MLLRKKKVKTKLPVAEVNIVTLMDVLTTLLFFLLLASSMTEFSVLKASALPSSSVAQQDPKPQFSLQIAIESRKKASIFIGPIEKLNPLQTGKLDAMLGKKYKGNASVGYVRTIKGRNLIRVMRVVQRDLIQLKKSFPAETKAVVVLSDQVRYQGLVDTLALVRSLPDNAKAFQYRDLLGQIRTSRVLFPEVIISEMDPDVTVAGAPGA